MVGWESLYEVAIEKRWFEGTHESPFESVFYADFEELINKLSIYNLMNA